jgi:hypothetical protein
MMYEASARLVWGCERREFGGFGVAVGRMREAPWLGGVAALMRVVINSILGLG